MLIKEATWGTALTPTISIPVEPPKNKEYYGSIYDIAYRGIAAKHFGYYQGERRADLEVPTYFWPDVSGHFLMALLGVDTTTGANPYTHSFTLATTPPSYTFSDNQGNIANQSRQYAGCTVHELTLKWSAPNKLMLTPKVQGKASTLIATPAFAGPATSIFVGWQCAATIGGSSNLRVLDAEVVLKREYELLYGMQGTQDPTDRVVGELEVNWKLLLYMNDYTDFNQYINNSQPAMSLVFTSGTNTLTIQCTKAAWEDPTEIMRDKTAYTLSVSAKGIYNATDAGPVKPILVNAQSTSY